MHNPFFSVQGHLTCDGVPLREIASSAGTPCYVYSAKAILDRYRAYDEALAQVPHTVCFAVKANSSLGVLGLLARAGAGFDIVSGGELFRVLKAGGNPANVVFSGVGKTPEEIEFALSRGIHSFNCESAAELELINEIAAKRSQVARVSLRVNPDVDAATHPYISTGLREHKFGIDIEEAEAIYVQAQSLKNLRTEGVSCHIGSQLLDSRPLMEAVDKVLALIDRLRAAGVPIEVVDLGGGLGVPYRTNETAPAIGEYGAELQRKVRDRGLHVMVEPGRSIVGEAGVLVTRVLFRKQTARKSFVIVDAAMNDLIRPALYQSHHEIVPLEARNGSRILADVVGPVCESGDFLARDREMPLVEQGELLAVCTAGAYGFVQSSNYNSRPRSAEVLVEDGQWRVIRARETLEDLVRGEAL